MKKHLTMGILAHVDAGKTTLSESIMYLSGSIRKLGRVDHGNAFLDTNELERSRGITIFSKQAVLPAVSLGVFRIFPWKTSIFHIIVSIIADSQRNE